jgi:hypothetical protein
MPSSFWLTDTRMASSLLIKNNTITKKFIKTRSMQAKQNVYSKIKIEQGNNNFKF